ncbi:hypothetical protein [Polyangium aurulentum]|uniref:hypothetical protein n=1 Tax=Polyangium aurulentum TaxID=2567896 RepID=UPI0010AE942A|nr:hypothetical protein [Polyangium aurulentum]UQA55201.1 hypothetical protein E8A73_028095 [Polyangium aurulentum]
MDLPAEPQIRWILRRTAALLEQGAEPVRGLVLPTASYFPDTFDGSPRAVAALLARVQAHAGLSDLEAELNVVTPEGEVASSGCSSGGCGPGGKIEARLDRVGRRSDGSYVVAVGTGEVGNPMVLTTALARSVACMFMTEAGAYDDMPPEDRERATDLAGVLLGFGVLLANGSHVVVKGCGGSKVHSATRMTVEEAGLSLAIFCGLFGVEPRAAAKHLDPGPREGFDLGTTWAESNATLVRRLRTDARSIARDEFVLGEARGWLSRVLGIGKSKRAATADETISALERSMRSAAPKKQIDPERSKKLAELRALVDESLDTR